MTLSGALCGVAALLGGREWCRWLLPSNRECPREALALAHNARGG